jgi:signal transduction histidine kinase
MLLNQYYLFIFVAHNAVRMKHSFLMITISIIAVLTLVLCWQIYWLRGLYQSIRVETCATLTTAVEMADFNEIAYRMKMWEKEKKEKRKKHQPVKEHLVSVDYDFDIYAQSPYKLMRLTDGCIHKVLDSLEPINLRVFCRLFQRECKKKGLRVDVYQVVFLNHRTGKSLYYNPPGTKVKDGGLITYHNTDGDYRYEVSVTPLTRVYLYRMQGLILTTVLIILLLAFAFWYLIRTVIGLRSIEEMKDDFTNNMTHELKTPIAVTYSAVDALLHYRQGDDKEKRERYLEICEQQLKRLGGLVEKILTVSMERRKTLTMNKEPVPLRPLIENLMEEYRLRSDKPITFHTDIADDMIINADKMHISNVLSNLMDNAIKYSGDDVVIRIRSYHQNEHDVIEMDDEGIGISEDHQRRIFDKFYRVPHGNVHNVGGYGLGLYYVHQIVSRHGGDITVKSAPGKGAKFTITLPAK